MASIGINLAKLVDYTEVEDGPWWRVGSGSTRAGQVGQQIGVIGLKHGGGYEIVMQMQSGKIETFRPLALFPLDRPAIAAQAKQGGAQ